MKTQTLLKKKSIHSISIFPGEENKAIAKKIKCMIFLQEKYKVFDF